jgi:hypothetical protein
MRLPGIRWGVRGVLMLGVVASTVANVLHAEPNVISRTIAAWPPLALLLTIELISRIPVHRVWLAASRLCAAAAIAGIAAWVSYWHMAGVALRYGEASGAAHLLPLSVDGLIVVASICLVELGGRIRAAEESTQGGSDGNQLGQDRPQSERGDHLGGGEGIVGAGEGDGPQGRRAAGGDPAPVGEGAAPEVAEVNLSRPRKPHTTNPDRVRRAYERSPEADPAVVARRLNLSLATVKKYRPPKKQSAQVNGKVPDLDLEGAKS